MNTRTNTANLFSLAAATAMCFAFLGSVSHADFVWTGGAGGSSNWYDAGNWVGGLVPNLTDSGSPTANTYAVDSTYATDLVIWDSETAVGGYMPTATLSSSNDWFGGAGQWHLSPGTVVRNGTINFGATGASWWSAGHNAVDLEVGDGDMGTAAVINMGWKEVDRYLKDTSNGLVIVVNADGTVNQLTDLDYYGNHATVQLNGGKWIVNGSVTDLTSDEDSTFVFEAEGAEFSADFGAGSDFEILADVTAQLGDSFVLGGSLASHPKASLVATDNLNGTFTVDVLVIPEPSTIFLAGLGLLGVCFRRR